MTIQEAIKTGRPFRRPDRDWWIYVAGSNSNILSILGGENRALKRDDEGYALFRAESILADDWLVMSEEDYQAYLNDESEQWIQKILSHGAKCG